MNEIYQSFSAQVTARWACTPLYSYNTNPLHAYLYICGIVETCLELEILFI